MSIQNKNNSRRDFLKKSTALAALTIAAPVLVKAAENDEKIAALFEQMPLRLEVNGVAHSLSVEPRVHCLISFVSNYTSWALRRVAIMANAVPARYM